MKNLLYGLAILSASMLVSEIKAQESFGNAGLEIALPVGDWAKDVYGIGIGGSGGYEVGITDNFAVNGTVGITFLSINSDASDFIKSSYLAPIQLGARYYLDETRAGLFGELQFGVHIFGGSTEDIIIDGTTVSGESSSETYFSFAPKVGFFVNEKISLSLRYQIAIVGDQEVASFDPVTLQPTTTTVEGDNIGYLGLKVAYHFD